MVRPLLIDRIKIAQRGDPHLQNVRTEVENGAQQEFRVHDDGSLRYGNRLCVPNVPEIKKEILEVAHNTGCTVHPGVTKLYKDLKETFWCNNMKLEIAQYVA